jgi:glycerol-3-phosphate acyltransferase PlsY
MKAAAVVLLGYLLGSVPTGLVVVRALTGTDIRRAGSGNIGTVNVLRAAGWAAAAAVLALDVAKGGLSVLLARAAGQPVPVQVAAGVAAVAGHNWSVFLRLQGGKGVATSLGVLGALSPPAAAVAVVVWAAVVAATRYASAGSLAALAAAAVMLSVRREPLPHLVAGALLAGLALWRHRANLARLRAGTELTLTGRSPTDRRGRGA